MKTRRVVLYSAVLYVILYSFLSYTGSKLTLYEDFWQLLDLADLRYRFWESMFYMHSQPPFLNFVLGITLWLEGLTGIRCEVYLAVLQFLVGGAIFISLAVVAGRLIKSRALYIVILALIFLNPVFCNNLFLYFYTLYELLYLSLLALFIYKYLNNPSIRYYIAICTIVVLMVYTRSLFHILWALPVILISPVLGKIDWKGRKYGVKTAVCAAVTVAVLLAWPAKNYSVFGFFGYSSWSGWNLSSSLPLENTPLYYIFYRPQAELLSPEQETYAESFVPERYLSVPALAELTKQDNAPNWNHYAVIILSRHYGDMAVRFILENPSILASKAINNYLNGYSLYEGRDVYSGKLTFTYTMTKNWAKLYEALVFQHFSGDEIFEKRTVKNGFAFIFPLVVLLSCAAIIVSFRSSRAESVTAAFMLYCVLWVLSMVLLVDGTEGNRIRSSTEPYTFILAGWAVETLWGRWKARRTG